MEEQNRNQPNLKKLLLRILLIAAAIFAPCIDWVLFSWTHALLPLLVFFTLKEQGFYSGNRVVLIATVIGFLVCLSFSSVSLFVFALTLIPAGFVLTQSANKKESPALAGLKSTVVVCIGWAICLSGILTPGEQAPYLSLIDSLHAGIDEVIDYYRVKDNGSVEMDMAMEATFLQLKVGLPLILPSILTSFAMVLVFFTTVVGNRLVLKKCNEECWPPFQEWKISEKLIWLAIATGIAVFVPVAPVRFTGSNLLILLSLIYCFQGFSIAVFFMNKWNVPILMRSFIYVIVIFQSFGTAILLVIGVADTWLNLRKLPLNKTETDE